jgi:hypothetical protein
VADRSRRRDSPRPRPVGSSPLPKLGGCAFWSRDFSVGGVPFQPVGGFAPGAGSLTVRGGDLYFSSSCEGGVMQVPISVLEDSSKPAEQRVSAITTVAARAFSIESITRARERARFARPTGACSTSPSRRGSCRAASSSPPATRNTALRC